MGRISNHSKNKYNAKAYEDTRLRVPKGAKEEVPAFAEANGENRNGFVNRAISEAGGRAAATGIRG